MGYMCLHTKFVALGQQAICHLCSHISALDPSVQGPSNESGKRSDTDQFIQLKYGTFEYRLEGLQAKPSSPAFVFCLDIGQNSVMSGFFAQAVQSIKQCLDFFPAPELTEICIMTFNHCL